MPSSQAVPHEDGRSATDPTAAGPYTPVPPRTRTAPGHAAAQARRPHRHRALRAPAQAARPTDRREPRKQHRPRAALAGRPPR
ncbi:hypothetical protein ACWEQ2_18520, partial [Streptomyces sp. NPDC004096]